MQHHTTRAPPRRTASRSASAPWRRWPFMSRWCSRCKSWIERRGRLARRAPSAAEAGQAFQTAELKMAARETGAKFVATAALARQLRGPSTMARAGRTGCARHLSPLAELKQMLRAAGCPDTRRNRHKPCPASRHRQAYFIRRRFTVLDFAWLAGVFEGMFLERYIRSRRLLGWSLTHNCLKYEPTGR